MPTPPLAAKLIAECKATKSKTLDLGRCGLTEWPEELWELTWLEELNLRNRNYDYEEEKWIPATQNQGLFNTLHVIPKEIKHLKSLEKIELGGSGTVYGDAGTGILAIDTWYISDLSVLSGLTNLQSLNVSWTSISDLSVLSGLTNLQSLNLESTQVSDLSVLSGLTNLQSLNLESTQVSDLSVLSGLTNLQSLNLESTQVSDLSVLSGLTNLQSLNVGYNKNISDLSVLSGLTNLQSLNLYRTQVSDLSVLSGLTNLQSLNLYRTQVSDLSVLSGLTNLQSLNVRNTEVSDLSVLSGLTNLQSLNVRNTEVSDLSVLSGLTNLQSLNVSWTSISDLSVLSGLTNLQSLNVSWTSISDLSVLSGLTNLQSLNLESTQVSDLSVLSGLTNLQSLNLESTQVSDLSVLSGLTNLQSLNVGYNKNISDLSVLSGLTNLQSLNVRNTEVSDLSVLSGLTNLQSLNLYSTQVSDLSVLTNLQSLNVRNTEVSDLSVLSGLTNLQSLNVSWTSISDLSVLSGLTNLQSLNLYRTQVSDLSVLSGLTNLQSLNVSWTSISDLSVLSGLTNLQSLNLESTQVSDLSVLSGLTNLQSLDIRKTQVSDLKPLIPLLQKGISVQWRERGTGGIQLFECPLISPSPEIAKQGRKAILKYFEDLEDQGSDKLFEAKLLILGEGGAGKTSLARRLLDEKAPMPEEEETTKGIAITQMHFPMPEEEEEFCVNVWDFGGQEIYHATHQFFLTKRSLYVLVDDTRSSDHAVNDKSFNYWLQTVELFGDGSPLMIVQNEKSDRSKQLDLRSMRSKFDFIKENKATNLQTCRGLAEIKTEIKHQIQQLPHVGMTLPKHWVEVREKLGVLAGKKSYITWEKFKDLCEDTGITDLDQMQRLSRTLHDLGVFLHFQNDDLLRKTLILQNEWATEAVYKVIDDEVVKKAFGRFSKADTPRIWKDSKYADMRGELLALMQKFEICFELDTRDHFLIPQLLPGSQPESHVWDATDNLQLRFRYGFMPKGLLSRFIVRFHRYVIELDKAWKSGVVLERNGASAEVRETYNESEIAVRVRGENRKELLTLIKEEFVLLHEDFKGIRVETLIPCNCGECQVDKEPYFFKQKVLEKAKDKGRPSVECQKSFDQVPILPLTEEIFIQDFKEEEPKDKPRIKDRSIPTQNYTSKKVTMTRSDQIKDLFIQHKLNDALEAINEEVNGTHHQTTGILLLSQFNSLQNDITKEILRQDDQQRRTNSLIHRATGFLETLEKEYPDKLNRTVEVEEPDVEAIKDVENVELSLPSRPLKGFVSYAHEDQTYQKQFAKYLSLMEMDGVLDSWVDARIVAGEEWDDKIKQNLEEAEVIFLLISIDFMTSKYIRENELNIAMQKHNNKTARVIPIIIRDCPWQKREFAKLQAANTHPVGEPVNDQAWVTIYEKIKESVKKFQGN